MYIFLVPLPYIAPYIHDWQIYICVCVCNNLKLRVGPAAPRRVKPILKSLFDMDPLLHAVEGPPQAKASHNFIK